MLEIKNLSKKFKKEKIIDDLSTNFSKTGITVIVGINGSGKTTFLNMITNLLQPDSGEILLDELTPGSRAYKSKFFYLPSDFYLPDYMTGREYAEFVLGRYDTSNYDQLPNLLKLLDMKEYENKTIESYSFGMKKKIQIAVAISADTEYIIADEILGGLDFDTTIIVQEIFAAISKRKKIIIVSHERNTMDCFPDDIRLMRNGKLTSFTGSPDELTKFIKQESTLHEKLTEIQKCFIHP